MTLNELSQLFLRDIDRLQKEVDAYAGDDLLWAVGEGISNSGGNLCLHLCGNLRHYIGYLLGGMDYTRDRDFEFSARNIKRGRLIKEIGETRRMVDETLNRLEETDLRRSYPEKVLGYEMTTGYFLIHLYGHLNYHLGQINYHRRLYGPDSL